MSHPVISVLMPVYNAERYVAEAVESILAQTHRDFEFLIVDDGSTDSSLKILRRYEARDGRIRLISRPNTGYLVALNEMIGRARGDLLARMDADDISLPDRFARQVDFLERNPDVACVGGAYIVIDERGRRLIQMNSCEDDATIQDLALSGHTPIMHPAAMMRREKIIAVGGYRSEMYTVEDLDLWLRLGECGRLANLSHPVLKYREHAGSVSHKNQEIQRNRAKFASDQACDRRGIPRRQLDLVPFRPGADRASRHRFLIRNGWWAFLSRERRTALHYGLRSIVCIPWRTDGWRLLACALVKSMR
jgi:glycosyltransferase involved in cell wall biosynthesis